MLNLHMEGGWEERWKMLDKLNLWNKIDLKETWCAITHICLHNNRNWLVLNTEAWILNELLQNWKVLQVAEENGIFIDGKVFLVIIFVHNMKEYELCVFLCMNGMYTWHYKLFQTFLSHMPSFVWSSHHYSSFWFVMENLGWLFSGAFKEHHFFP